MKFNRFNNRAIAYTMPLLMSAVAFSAPVHAQDTDDDSVEEITVTGIRGSLKKSMDMKKKARGVVDAINAEDMGKFPDTNLAESLQRITGVSIDRNNGEGQRITVRGMGPEFNLVTFNGRQMPVSSLQATGPSASRSFDFGNIASEGISSIEVYKTSKASLTTGGIGSTLNIKTTRPLESPGLKATIGAKALFDQSRNDGTSRTPEFSGLFSNTFADDTFGIAVSGSYQKRKSSYNDFGANYLGTYKPGDADWGTLPVAGTEAIPGVVEPSGTYAVPLSFNYGLNDVDYERLNGQITLQFQPTDSLRTTLDYTHSEFTQRFERNDMSVWFTQWDQGAWWFDGGSVADYTDGEISGPEIYRENFEPNARGDMSYGAGFTEPKNTNKSIGFNVEWDATDNLRLEFDVHHSSAYSRNTNPYGVSSAQGSAAFSIVSQGIDFTNEFPLLLIGHDDGADTTDVSRMQATGSAFRNSIMRMEIDQAQINGSWDFDDMIVDSVDFGASYVENKYRSAYALAQYDQYWGGVGSPDDFPDDMFTKTTVSEHFDQFEGSDSADLYNDWVLWDFEQMVGLVDGLVGTCGGTGQCSSENWTTDRRTTEKQKAAYIQLNSNWEMFGNDANFVFGLRYEDTEVISSALVPIPTGTSWNLGNEAYVTLGDNDFTMLEGSYSYWLPSVDFDFQPMDDLIIRASLGRTMTRPGYADIQGGQTVDTLFRSGGGFGNQGNPNLLPHISSNFDMSAEWYYNDSSYLAVSYFSKDVKNYIGSSSITDTVYGLPDPFTGAAITSARAALGQGATPDDIRAWISSNIDPNLIDADGNLLGVDGADPLLEFTINIPVNERSAKINGWEIALQHTFGDSGFGVIANYTIVNSDTSYDDTQSRLEGSQFAIPGLSDSANIIGFYDKNGIQVRVAYNWRDEFLSSTGGGAHSFPSYVESYGQLDISASYDVNDNWSVYAEGYNVLNNTFRIHSIHENMVVAGGQTGSRYAIGARYKF